jgi:hypothetical protein
MISATRANSLTCFESLAGCGPHDLFVRRRLTVPSAQPKSMPFVSFRDDASHPRRESINMALRGALGTVRATAGFCKGGKAEMTSYEHALFADLVFSGTETLPDWGLQLWWPFSATSYVYPLVAWGDAGVSIAFVAGMLAMWKWPSRLQLISAATLMGAASYVVVRGAFL